MVFGMNLLMSHHVVLAGERLPTLWTLKRLIAVVAVHMTIQIDFASEVLPADTTHPLGSFNLALIQRSEFGWHRCQIAHFWMISSHMLFQLSFGNETEGALIAGLDHTLKGPVVPFGVLVSVLAGLESLVKVGATWPFALEIILAVERLVLQRQVLAWSFVLHELSVPLHSGGQPGDTYLVPFLGVWVVLLLAYLRPELDQIILDSRVFKSIAVFSCQLEPFRIALFLESSLVRSWIVYHKVVQGTVKVLPNGGSFDPIEKIAAFLNQCLQMMRPTRHCIILKRHVSFLDISFHLSLRYICCEAVECEVS